MEARILKLIGSSESSYESPVKSRRHQIPNKYSSRPNEDHPQRTQTVNRDRSRKRNVEPESRRTGLGKRRTMDRSHSRKRPNVDKEELSHCESRDNVEVRVTRRNSPNARSPTTVLRRYGWLANADRFQSDSLRVITMSTSASCIWRMHNCCRQRREFA